MWVLRSIAPYVCEYFKAPPIFVVTPSIFDNRMILKFPGTMSALN